MIFSKSAKIAARSSPCSGGDSGSALKVVPGACGERTGRSRTVERYRAAQSAIFAPQLRISSTCIGSAFVVRDVVALLDLDDGRGLAPGRFPQQAGQIGRMLQLHRFATEAFRQQLEVRREDVDADRVDLARDHVV